MIAGVRTLQLDELHLLRACGVVLYGAGAEGRRFFDLLASRGVTPRAFCDASPGKVGHAYCGIDTIPIAELKNLPEGCCILVSLHESKVDQVQAELRSFGIAAPFVAIDERPFLDRDGKLLIFDELAWLRSGPPHLRQVYQGRTTDPKAYFNEVADHPLRFYLDKGGFAAEDMTSRLVNARDGVRVTAASPEQGDFTVYVCGSSVALGHHNEDAQTIASRLQYRMNQELLEGRQGRAVNKGIYAFPLLLNADDLDVQPLRPGDFVFFVYGSYLILGPGHGNRFSAAEALELFAHYILRMKASCENRGGTFVFCLQPFVGRIRNPSESERFLAEDCVVYHDPHFGLVSVDAEALLQALRARGVEVLDGADPCQRPHPFGELFIDRTHLSPAGNDLLAALFWARIRKGAAGDPGARSRASAAAGAAGLVRDYEDSCRGYLDRHLPRFREQDLEAFRREHACHLSSPGVHGCIVVNCNPFTRGHRFLIETAARRVDHLFVFVLEEDRSFFPFEDRMELVRQGTVDLANVTVLRSGSLIISSLTFPEYFQKDQSQDRRVDCGYDLDTFCRVVAPAMGIRIRFVGTEPFCRITGQYNQQMKEVLPRHGIEVVEVERYVGEDGEAISASRVRKALEKGDWDQLRRLVPDSTLAYLRRFRASRAANPWGERP